jgi:hypothetical protein
MTFGANFAAPAPHATVEAREIMARRPIRRRKTPIRDGN